MRNTKVYALGAISVLALSVVITSSATAGGQSGALVRLQSGTPGVTQTGHLNIDGTAVVGKLGVGDTTPAALFTVGSGDKLQVYGDGSVRFNDPLAGITFPATGGANGPMIKMFASGSGNADRMVIAHSGSFTDWGLEYQDAGDQFNFMGSGVRFMSIDLGAKRVGIGTTTPTAPFEVAGVGGSAKGGTATEGFLVSGGGQSARLGTADEAIVATGGNRAIYASTSAWDPNSSEMAAIIGENTRAGAGVGIIGKGDSVGVYGLTSEGWAFYGLSNLGRGIYASTSSGYGVFGKAFNSSGYAGYFEGKVHIAGTLSKSGGSFKIDDPRDPENKYLVHSFVESPDMMNVYNGVTTTNSEGLANVQLPSYFNTLNKDFRYQLTVIGGEGFALAKIEREIENNMFVIRTNEPNVKVSWQVTGVRQDPWANANRIVPEQEKPENEKGKYLNPEVYGQPDSKRLGYDARDTRGAALVNKK